MTGKNFKPNCIESILGGYVILLVFVKISGISYR